MILFGQSVGGRLGIRGTADVAPPLASVAEATYGPFADYLRDKMGQNTGQTLYQHLPAPRLVADPVHAYTVTRLLENFVNRGTGYAVRRLGYRGPVAGKTGTTNDNTDTCFTGFTPDIVANVWIDFDSGIGGNKLTQPKTRRQITGGGGAAPIWTECVPATPTSTGQCFVPPDVGTVEIDPSTGTPAGAADSLSVPPITVAIHISALPALTDSL